MNSTTRLVLALLMVLGVSASLYYLASGENDAAESSIDDPNRPPEPTGLPQLALNESAQCEACHPEIYREWEQSQHALAWVNPEPRRKELSDNFKNKDCIPCHAPRPQLEVGYGYGARPLEREDRREEGVSCFSCHKYKNTMVGVGPLSTAAASAPCQPQVWAPIAEPDFCAPCHDQHKVGQDWLRSRFADKKGDYRDCNSCHMPVKDGPGTKGLTKKTHRSHLFGGGHDAATLKTSATLKVALVAEGQPLGPQVEKLSGSAWQLKDAASNFSINTRRLVLGVENTGVGHNLPSDERHRAVDLSIEYWDASGEKSEPVQLTRFRNPYRHEFEILNPFEDKAGEVIAKFMETKIGPLEIEQVRVLPRFNPNRKIFYPKSTQLHAGEMRLLWMKIPKDLEKGGRLRISLHYKLNPYLKMNDKGVVMIGEQFLDL